MVEDYSIPLQNVYNQIIHERIYQTFNWYTFKLHFFHCDHLRMTHFLNFEKLCKLVSWYRIAHEQLSLWTSKARLKIKNHSRTKSSFLNLNRTQTKSSFLNRSRTIRTMKNSLKVSNRSFSQLQIFYWIVRERLNLWLVKALLCVQLFLNCKGNLKISNRSRTTQSLNCRREFQDFELFTNAIIIYRCMIYFDFCYWIIHERFDLLLKPSFWTT